MTFHQSYNEGTLNEMLLEVLITVFTVSPPLLSNPQTRRADFRVSVNLLKSHAKFCMDI